MQSIGGKDLDLSALIHHLKAHPLTQKDLNYKSSRLNEISSTKEHQLYIPDVKQLHQWLLIFNYHLDFRQIIQTEKLQKQFLYQYLAQYIKHLIYCKQFKLEDMMQATQAVMFEGMNFFLKHFEELEKLPGMISIVKAILDPERQFFKRNFHETKIHIMPQFTKEEEAEMKAFADQLKLGDKVDGVKTQFSTGRKMWSPAVITKLGTQTVVVQYQGDRIENQRTLSKTNLEAFPLGSMTKDFHWRKELKVGDEVDFQFNKTFWKKVKIVEIEEIKEIQNSVEVVYKVLKVEDRVRRPWVVSPMSPAVQLPNTFSKDDIDIEEEYHLRGSVQNDFFDDYNDILLAKETCNQVGALRPNFASHFFLHLLNHFHKMKGLDMLLDRIKNPATSIQTIKEILSFISQTSPVFHRKFAHAYIPVVCETAKNAILHCSESNIRLFTKDILSSILESIFNLTKRYMSVRQRHKMQEQIKMPIIKMFIDSEFLDRKLNSIALLTDLIRQSKADNQYLKTDPKELEQWFIDNEIIHKIYYQNSHSEIISRSAELLKLYLSSKPSTNVLETLLNDLSESVVKVISDNSSDIPLEFLKKVAVKLTNQNKININDDIIQILRKVGGYQDWALQRGGQFWVNLVKYKKNKQPDLQILFQQDYDIICRVFIDMVDQDAKISTNFVNTANNLRFIRRFIDSDFDTHKKLEFLKYFFREQNEIQDQDIECFYRLWNQTYKIQNKTFTEAFKNIMNTVPTRQKLDFAENCFTSEKLKDISSFGFLVFKKVVGSINNADHESIEFPERPYGIAKLLEMVFENQRLEVTKMALEFIFILIDNMDTPEQITEFKENLLKKCLNRLYETQNYEKYLSLLEGILNESEKFGNGGLEPLARQFPTLSFAFTIHNNFNTHNRSRFYLTVKSNITLYELRYLIGKHINAYGNEIRLSCSSGNSQFVIEQLSNGLTLEQISLPHKTLIASKKSKLKKVELTDDDDKLVPQAIVVVAKMFKDYSNDGLMSKENCRKLIKKLGQDTTYMIGQKVDKIFDSYDADRDGRLKLEDLNNYFEHLAITKPTNAWNLLEAVGIRDDLRILGDVELSQPQPETLPRYLLMKNKQFMELLFKLIKQDDSKGQIAWKLLFRLPVYTGFSDTLDLSTRFELRYWLYLQDWAQKNDLNEQIFNHVIKADEETLLIGLKVAERINLELSFEQLQVLLDRVKSFNKQKSINTTNQLILGFSLKFICKGLDRTGQTQDNLLDNNIKIEEMFMTGILSQNPTIRKPYLDAINGIIELSRNSNPIVFRRLYVMLVKGLETELTLLTSEYFELFAKMLVFASNKQEFQSESQAVLDKIIKIFEDHKSTEKNLAAPEDQISIGLIKLINGSLLLSNIHKPGLITFVLNECLFPQQNNTGLHKLRSHSSRKLAYDLIVTLCRNADQSLKQLFNSNFKRAYKKASHMKDQYFSPKIRSQYGYCGIHNLGCICYMISMIQQFFMVSSFRYLIMIVDDGKPEQFSKIQKPQPIQNPYYIPVVKPKEDRTFDDNTLHQFQILFANLQLSQKQDINPTDFCSSFKDFEGNPINVIIQQDAQEFLNMLFDKLETGIKETPFKNIIQSIYGGKYCSQLVCSSCNKISERHENFFNLSLEVKGHKNIFESFDKYIEGEVISEYKCQGCDKKADTTKRCYISELPNYLILHLQRICFNYDKFENEKVNSRLEFPHDLDVYPYTLEANREEGGNKPANTEDYQYKLKGIVVHIGSADFGHYFSYIRGDNGKWLEYNDDNIRDFDPNDIEDDAFGGGSGYRKENQSAYILMYEKVKKSEIKLEFNTEEEKQRVIRLLKATEVYREEKEEGLIQEEIAIQQRQEQEQELVEGKPESSIQMQEQRPETMMVQKKVIAYLDLDSISQYVNPQYRQSINKANQQFTLDIHLTNNQFLAFIYNISKIDTKVPELRSELLFLCSQTYNSSYNISSGNNVSLSSQLPGRFNQLIAGQGWNFFVEKSATWHASILVPDMATRIATKNVMVPVISDVMKNMTENKDVHLKQFLFDFWDLSKSEEMEWNVERATQYFEFWAEILGLHPEMLNFFEQFQAIDELLRLVITDKNFPRRFSKNKRKFFEYNNDQPAKFIINLIEQGYNLCKHEFKGIASFTFLSKLIGQHVGSAKALEIVCRNHSLISERVCYLLLTNFYKANHSNQIKPLAEKTHSILSIDDSLKRFRIEWMFGHHQLSEHIPGVSVGIYGLTGPDEQMRTYYSPLGIYPILQTLFTIKQKFDHVTILMVIMLLEFQRDGLINLRDYPPQEAVYQDYTHWFGKFITSYKPAQGEIYKEYKTKATNLWRNRQEKELSANSTDEYIVGKIVTEKEIEREPNNTNNLPLFLKKPENQNRKIEVEEFQCIVNISHPEYDEDGVLVHSSNIIQRYNIIATSFINQEEILANVENSHLFLRKFSSDTEKDIDENNLLDSPFKNPFECNYVRKIKFHNPTKNTRCVTFKLTFLTDSPNTTFPTSPCRFSLPPQQDQYFVLTKKDPFKEWSEYRIQWDETIEKSRRLLLFSSDDELPREIFTAESDDEEENEESDDEDDDDDMYPSAPQIW